MFDPKQLLDSFLGAGNGSRPGAPQAGNAPRSGSGGFLGDIVNSLGGSEGLKQGAGRAIEMARQNPAVAGGLLAGVLGTGMGRGLAGSALKYGGLAAIASMAYKAYQDHQAGQQPAQAAAGMPDLQPPPANTAFDPAAAPQGSDQFALTLIRVMIAAAKADGTIDEEERARIGDRAKLSGMDAEAEAWIKDELAKPVDLEGLVAQAQSEAQRVELYTAARLAIDPDKRAERGFLDQLAGRLGLEDALVEHIEATVSSAAA